MRCLDTLASSYVKRGYREESKETISLKLHDSTLMLDLNHLLSRAYFCLLEGDQMDQAEVQFK